MSTPQERALQRIRKESESAAQESAREKAEQEKAKLQQWREFLAEEKRKDYPGAVAVKCCSKRKKGLFSSITHPHSHKYNEERIAYILKRTSDEYGVYSVYCFPEDERVVSSPEGLVCFNTDKNYTLETFMPYMP